MPALTLGLVCHARTLSLVGAGQRACGLLHVDETHPQQCEVENFEILCKKPLSSPVAQRFSLKLDVIELSTARSPQQQSPPLNLTYALLLIGTARQGETVASAQLHTPSKPRASQGDIQKMAATEDTANFPFARGGALAGFPAGPPLLERDKVTIEGLAFIGLSLSRNHPEQPFAHPASGTFGQTLPHISHILVCAPRQTAKCSQRRPVRCTTHQW